MAREYMLLACPVCGGSSDGPMDAPGVCACEPEPPSWEPVTAIDSRDVAPLVEAARIGLDMAERAHGGAPREGEDYYAHRDAIRAALKPFTQENNESEEERDAQQR